MIEQDHDQCCYSSQQRITTTFHIDDLPSEILHIIQSFIYDEWNNFRLVCKEWSDIYCNNLILKIKVDTPKKKKKKKGNDYLEQHKNRLMEIKKMCKSEFLEHVHEIEFNQVTTPILQCIFACKHFKKLEFLSINGVFKCQVLGHLLKSENTFINNLKYLEIYHLQNTAKLNRVIEKCANETSNSLLYYFTFISSGDVKYLYKSAELNYLPAIQYIIDKYAVENSNEREKWLVKGSELGDYVVQILLADYYVKRNEHAKAMQWFSKAIELTPKAKIEYIISYANEFGIHYCKQDNGDKAKECFTISAERGDAYGQYCLGTCYNIEFDYNNAFKWFLKSAEQGNHDAQFNVGVCYANGNGTEPDMSKAVGWYMKSADQGNDLARYTLAICYETGKGIEKDVDKAFDFYLKSALQGYDNAQFVLGICYKNGIGTEQDFNKAFEWFMKAANQGNSASQNNVGYCYLYGVGIEKDISKSLEWYLIAAENGNDLAQNTLGGYYETGSEVEKDLNKAFEWYLKSAEQGNATAQNNVADCYQNGIGTEKDLSKAFEWYLKAAEKGNALAQNNVGYAYQNGMGIDCDYTKGFEWYAKSAEQGNEISLNNMGYCYETGKGVEKDTSKAFEWYLKSAEKGYVRAQYNLADCYENGIGTEKDMEKALEWYLKSAEQGHVSALYSVGFYYENERIDHYKSFEYYLKAAEKGNNVAKYKVGCMYCKGKGTQSNVKESLKWLIEANSENERSEAITEFLQHFGLLGNVSRINSVSIFENLAPTISEFTINDCISSKICDCCRKACNGFYYSTLDCDLHGDSSDVCLPCWEDFGNQDMLEELKEKLGDRQFSKTHFLADFLPLIEFCKLENQVNNLQLDEIILQLKQCAVE